MAVYPSSPVPRYGTTRGKRREAIRTESEAAYGRTRPRFTRSRDTFTLEYNGITSAEFDTLLSFFEANQGTVFDFYYPNDVKLYKVMFAMDELIKKEVTYNIVDTTVQLVTI